MSKNKKVIIGLTVAGVIIIILSIVGIFIYKDKSTNNIVSGENDINSIEDNAEENAIINETNTISEEMDNNVQNNEQIIEEDSENVPPIINKEIPKQTPKKENNKTTQNQANKQSEKTPQKQEEQPKTIPKEQPNNQQETVPIVPPVAEKCTNNNNHGMGVGNSGRWFNSREEAVKMYESEIKMWGEKWTNYEIDNETYYKNCPDGYEIWSCPICGKWTINLYY